MSENCQGNNGFNRKEWEALREQKRAADRKFKEILKITPTRVLAEETIRNAIPTTTAGKVSQGLLIAASATYDGLTTTGSATAAVVAGVVKTATFFGLINMAKRDKGATFELLERVFGGKGGNGNEQVKEEKKEESDDE